MNKADLIRAVTEKCNFTRKEAEEVVNTFLSSIIHSVNRGEDVELRGFGCFRIRNRSPRVARNLNTGEQVVVEARRVASFKLGQGLKDMLNPPDGKK